VYFDVYFKAVLGTRTLLKLFLVKIADKTVVHFILNNNIERHFQCLELINDNSLGKDEKYFQKEILPAIMLTMH